MRLYSLFTIVAGSAVGDHYDISGWDPKCDKIPEGCANGGLDAKQLSKCLIDNNLKCSSKLDVTLTIDKPKLSVEQTTSGLTLAITIKKPSFPGGWRLRMGSIDTRNNFLLPLFQDVALNGSTIVFKEGPVTDFNTEDFSTWTPLGCTFGENQIGEVTEIRHPFECSNIAHELLKNVQEATLVMVNNDATPVEYVNGEPPLRGELIWYRTTTAPKITQVSEEDMHYSMSWADSCKDVPNTCVGHEFTYEAAKKCIESHRKPYCEVSLSAYMNDISVNPIPLRIKGVDAFVEGVFIDPAKVLFTDIIPSNRWKEGLVGYSFPTANSKDANIYVSPNFGDFSGKLNKVLPGSHQEITFFDNAFDISQPGGKFVYLDRVVPGDVRAEFEAVIEITETRDPKLTTTTTKPTTTTTKPTTTTTTTPTTTTTKPTTTTTTTKPTTTTTKPTTTTTKPTTTTTKPTTTSTFARPQVDGYTVAYGIKDTKCGNHPTVCVESMGFFQVKKCLEELKKAQPNCKIIMSIYGERTYGLETVNLNGVITRVPYAPFNLAKLSNVGSVQWKHAVLDGVGFVISPDAKPADVYLSDSVEGINATKVISKLSPRDKFERKENVPVKLTQQYLFLDTQEYTAMSQFEALFRVSEI